LMNRKPASPSHTLAYPGREDHGPVWPYPEMRVNINPGLVSRSASGPRPHFSRAARGVGEIRDRDQWGFSGR
jgi:hypothetical protein